MRRVLVTGASRRVGAHLVRSLCAAGDAVVFSYRRSEGEARALRDEMTAQGHRCEAIACDLLDAGDRDSLIARAAEALGGLDALVNNASLFEYDTLDTLAEARWQVHLDTNLKAPLFLTRDFARHVRAENIDKASALAPGRAVVVNLLDHKVTSPNPDYFSYTAGKMGLAGMIAPLAMACAPQVRVCAIAPGVTLPSGPQSESDFHKAAAATPLGITSSLDDVARALRFALDTPSFCGQILVVDGGEALVRRPRDVAFDEL
ncbi:MAG: SDR family NAD(P)-dependent oxidoreductase [Brevundimonas sp.]|uniref:SDR family NAD(P)-dependent oxidoreductase n=1 Tax=Brevundimonas sp. TaxID=1871086 RepID=UPI00391D8425